MMLQASFVLSEVEGRTFEDGAGALRLRHPHPDALHGLADEGPAALGAGASEVYLHGMPGGQFTNLREQARSLGIDDVRWPEVARSLYSRRRFTSATCLFINSASISTQGSCPSLRWYW